jgi:hypothetical protein
MFEAVNIWKVRNFYETTLHNIPRDNHIHNRRRDNLKSYKRDKDQ